MKENNKIIVWNVTSKCNLNCKFCFGPDRVEASSARTRVAEDFNEKQGFEMIDKFKKTGAEKIVFTGGEPLTRKDLVDLIRYAKEKEFYTILHTNGFLLTLEKLSELDKYLDQINLPIDGDSEETSKIMRGSGIFEKVNGILEWLKNFPKIRIVILTVVTKVNKNCIIKIAKILPDYIYKWRVFQFKAIGRAKLFKEKYEVDDDDNFKKIGDKIKKLKLNFEVQCVKKNDDFYKSYIEI